MRAEDRSLRIFSHFRRVVSVKAWLECVQERTAGEELDTVCMDTLSRSLAVKRRKEIEQWLEG